MSEEAGPSALERARRDGRQAAGRVLDAAPDHPQLRVAWAAGFGHGDQLQAAIDSARDHGFTWRQIGEAMDQNWRTVQSRYGPGQAAAQRYRARKRAATKRPS